MSDEGRRFIELAVHVKLASEAVLEAARSLASLRPGDIDTEEAHAWRRTADELLATNVELGFIERILRAVTGAEITVSDPRSLPS